MVCWFIVSDLRDVSRFALKFNLNLLHKFTFDDNIGKIPLSCWKCDKQNEMTVFEQK